MGQAVHCLSLPVQVDRSRRCLGYWLDTWGWHAPATPYRIILREPAVQLKAYFSPDAPGPAVLLLPAPIKSARIWDLAPSRSVVRACLDAGMRTYLLEWRTTDCSNQRGGLSRYADQLILDCVRAIAADTSERTVVVAAHSLGGTLAAIFASLHPELVRSLVLIEAPINFEPRAGAFAAMGAMSPTGGALGALGDSIPGSILDVMAWAASPLTFVWLRWLDSLASLADPRALRTYLLVERWTLDEFAMPGLLFEDVAERLCRRNEFMRGTLRIDGRTARPDQVVAPVLAVANPKSDIVPPAAVLPFLRAVKSRRRRVLRYEAEIGVSLQHVAPLVGAEAHAHLWPEVFRTIRADAASPSLRSGTLAGGQFVAAHP